MLNRLEKFGQTATLSKTNFKCERTCAGCAHDLKCDIQENQIKVTRGNRVKWYILHRRCENVCVRWTTIGQKEREREKLIRFYFQTCRPVPCSIADDGLHQHPSSDVYNIHVLLHVAFVSTGRHFSLSQAWEINYWPMGMRNTITQ